MAYGEKGVYRVLVGIPEGKRQLGRPRRRWVDNIKMDLQEVGCGVRIRSSWLRIGTGGGNLWMRKWTFGFPEMREISWLAENQLASQEELCSMEKVSNKYCLFLWQQLDYNVSFGITQPCPFKTVSSQEAYNGPKPPIISGHGPYCFVFHPIRSCTADSSDSHVHCAASCQGKEQNAEHRTAATLSRASMHSADNDTPTSYHVSVPRSTWPQLPACSSLSFSPNLVITATFLLSGHAVA